ncbi:glycine--tRNA ligase subunit beta [Brevundimonas sp. S30B]|uniref:glycine--tRNA ligase subunit beta n=1 Tax=unclassified Brevundimonas TaxID=2622653 RepID=UPI001071DCA3|nr:MULTISPECIES: glycine--tRNA ligase subunit beta [unclassified Brevundimonas]QBX36346.1 glycine--tRNA ligase subunit beta [Brevundimonas sp. MF30-B]TFW01055.1 glycine--tRNA ligase subunit beta [Brevundimonas sp. S30B]
MPQLLIEIFSEEIPARMQAGAARDLERMAGERLKAAGLTWEALTTYAGPRRLTLVIDGLPTATPDREEELKGPKASAPPQALEGFLRKTGLTREQLVERDGVLFAQISSRGQRTKDVLPSMLFSILGNFPWPKSMRWGTGSARWVRPIKRVLFIFDGEIVNFSETNGAQLIESSNVTEGHRFLGSGQPFAVKDFADYRQKLEREFVLLDAADRRLRILEQAKAVCADKGLALVDDDGLLDEVSGLAEWPTPILGDMDPQFLDLPPEVVRLSMKVHQKYFAVRDPACDGLAPHFVVVANVEASDGGKALAAGNSRVLSARLNDARFFWDEDQKVGFDAWNEKLKGVTFHAKLGDMGQRVDRIAALAREIAPLVGADPDQAEQAARLAKADLASGMVGEFPELQGVMGGYYARAEHGDAIADAIRDHYKPQGPNDTVPTAPLTVAVALADKLDTLVGFFAIDEKPTGSKDPFALRRAALGVIRLVLENQIRMPLPGPAVSTFWMLPEDTMLASGTMPAAAIDFISQGDQFRREIYGPVERDMQAFFADRLKVLLRDQGQRHDLVDAVFALGDDDLVRIVRRVEALGAFLETDDGANLLAGYKRASNILRAEAKKGDLPTGMVQTGLPNQPEAETTLAFAVGAARTAVDQALEAEDFAAAMKALSGLRAPVDAFFEGVMVNSDVPAERENRLKLLGQVRDVMGQVADFGQIAG